MSKQILVSYRDGLGLPRAWARGYVEQRKAIEKRATRELAKYIEKKADVGEDLSIEDFTMHEEEIEA